MCLVQQECALLSGSTDVVDATQRAVLIGCVFVAVADGLTVVRRTEELVTLQAHHFQRGGKVRHLTHHLQHAHGCLVMQMCLCSGESSDDDQYIHATERKW